MNIKDVDNLAELAKIELSQAEKEQLLSDMESILGYVKQIESVEVPDIESEYKNRNVWREDLPASDMMNSNQEFSREQIIGQFPDEKDGFVKVKKIL